VRNAKLENGKNQEGGEKNPEKGFVSACLPGGTARYRSLKQERTPGEKNLISTRREIDHFPNNYILEKRKKGPPRKKGEIVLMPRKAFGSQIPRESDLSGNSHSRRKRGTPRRGKKRKNSLKKKYCIDEKPSTPQEGKG